MSRNSEALIDIQQAALRIMRFTENIGRAELEASEEKISAILDQIAIIGEATKRLALDCCQANPFISWRELAEMRDFIINFLMLRPIYQLKMIASK